MSDDKPPTKGEVAGSPEESPGEALRRFEQSEEIQATFRAIHESKGFTRKNAHKLFASPPPVSSWVWMDEVVPESVFEDEGVREYFKKLDEVRGLSFEEAYEILSDALGASKSPT